MYLNHRTSFWVIWHPSDGEKTVYGPLEPVENCVAILVKVTSMFSPMAVNAAMIATDIKAIMRPYSIAVTPDSSRTNVFINLIPFPPGTDLKIPGQVYHCCL